MAMSPKADTGDKDTKYFKAYGRLTIHRTMLRDRARMAAYANAIKGTDLRDKVVIDVGAGSGVLAMLAAKNKARKVYAGK